MSAAGRWFVTPHAVHRYIERIDPRATYASALAYLIDQSEVARPMREIESGIVEYRGARPRRLRFRVSTRLPGLPQLITVLGPFDGWRCRDAGAQGHDRGR